MAAMPRRWNRSAIIPASRPSSPRKKAKYFNVTLKDGLSDGSFIADILVRNGFRLKMLREEEIDLEDVFMGITKGITN